MKRRAKTGRPSKYSLALARRICAAIASSSNGLHTILKAAGMPSYRSVMRWLETHAAFRHMYARAREDQADYMADQMVEIADGATPEDVHVARLRVDTRKFAAMKLKPRKYGEKVQQEVSGPEGGAVRIDVAGPNLVDMTDEQLERFIDRLKDRAEDPA